MMRLIQASSGSGRSLMGGVGGGAPAVTMKRCRPSGSSWKRMPRLHGSGSMVRSGIFSRRASRGHRPALHDDRERHDDEDDLVDARRVRAPGRDDERAQQDRHRALEAGPQDEQALAAAQPDRPAAARPTSTGRITNASTAASARPISQAPARGRA